MTTRNVNSRKARNTDVDRATKARITSDVAQWPKRTKVTSASHTQTLAENQNQWERISDLWHDTQVRTALLDLQNRDGADVLWLLWLAIKLRAGHAGDSVYCQAAFSHAAPHRDRVRRIRKLRRQLRDCKHNQANTLVSGDTAELDQATVAHQTLYRALSAIELSAERLQWRSWAVFESQATDQLSTSDEFDHRAAAARPTFAQPTPGDTAVSQKASKAPRTLTASTSETPTPTVTPDLITGASPEAAIIPTDEMKQMFFRVSGIPAHEPDTRARLTALWTALERSTIE
ncbi:MAG: DUF2390 domain-containing protein [Thioalkalivibrionaceae bacterium]